VHVEGCVFLTAGLDATCKVDLDGDSWAAVQSPEGANCAVLPRVSSRLVKEAVDEEQEAA
jgi:hypothetical protein